MDTDRAQCQIPIIRGILWAMWKAGHMHVQHHLAFSGPAPKKDATSKSCQRSASSPTNSADSILLRGHYYRKRGPDTEAVLGCETIGAHGILS